MSTEPQLPVLEQRIQSTENLLDDIKDDVKVMRTELMEVHKAILNVGKPQYAVLSAAALVILGVTGGLWKLAVDPINDKLTDQKALILTLEGDFKLLESEKESRADIEGLRADLKAKIEELSQRLKHQ